jgi:hypothetical protein
MGLKSVQKDTNVSEALLLPEKKTECGLEKTLANLWGRKRITKKAHASSGQKTKW